jgi:hypothetical protein
VELVVGKPLVIDLTLRQSSIAVEAVTVAATRIT